MNKLIALLLVTVLCQDVYAQLSGKDNQQPNILFCIADDASFQHMSAYGFGFNKWITTPGFDKIAKEGLLFTRAYTPNAKCGPSRSCILTGRNSWQLEEAGNHNSIYPAKFTTFMEVLANNGYETGFTGKGWAPGNAGLVNGKPRELTGKEYSLIKADASTKDISSIDYTANFEQFLKNKPTGKPFCFWYGSREPHRHYTYGSGVAQGKKKISDIDDVPPFWIDNEKVRNDMLDYAFEVEHFDNHVLKMLQLLKERGELDNTIIVVTSDNGMPFPRVKGHVYDYDNHLPLAIMWKGHIRSPGRKINDFVSFIDFAPTFLEAAGLKSVHNMQPIQGRSLFNFFETDSSSSGEEIRDHVLLGRERGDIGRPDDEGYPVRAIVKGNFFFAINYEPGRWPSGNPETGYLDTDGSPTKTQLLEANHKGLYQDLWQLSFGKKPTEELYQTDKDPYSMNNLAYDPAFSKIKAELKRQMEHELKSQQDPRMYGSGSIFDKYPYSNPKIRDFYRRYMHGERPNTDWVNGTDFEKPDFKPAVTE